MSNSNLQQSSILITRPEHKAEEMAEIVSQMNGIPVLFPTITIGPPSDWTEIDSVISRLAAFDWLVFSSANGVKYFYSQLDQYAIDTISSSLRIAAVGPKTAKALSRLKFTVDVIPETYTAEGLVVQFGAIQCTGTSVLHITGDKGRSTLREGLQNLGARVTTVHAYRNMSPEPQNVQTIVDKLLRSRIDFLTFTSPSTFENFFEIINTYTDKTIELLKDQNIVTIGPVTSSKIEEYNIPVTITSHASTIESMLKDISFYCSSELLKESPSEQEQH